MAVPCQAAQCEYSVACYYSFAVEGGSEEFKLKICNQHKIPKMFNHRTSCSSPFSPTWLQGLVLHRTQSAVWWHSEGTSVDIKAGRLVKILDKCFHSLMTTSSRVRLEQFHILVTRWHGMSYSHRQIPAALSQAKAILLSSPALENRTKIFKKCSVSWTTIQQVSKAFQWTSARCCRRASKGVRLSDPSLVM